MEELQYIITEYPEDGAYKMALQEIQLIPESTLVSYELEYKAQSKLGEIQMHIYSCYAAFD